MKLPKQLPIFAVFVGNLFCVLKKNLPFTTSIIGNSERPKRQKLVSAETEASATSTEASAEASAESLPRKYLIIGKLSSKFRCVKKRIFSNWMIGKIWWVFYFLICTKMKYHFNSVNILEKLHKVGKKNYVKLAKNRRFCWFGDSASFTEASAELFRPILTEALAEASVSVVHYW